MWLRGKTAALIQTSLPFICPNAPAKSKRGSSGCSRQLALWQAWWLSNQLTASGDFSGTGRSAAAL